MELSCQFLKLLLSCAFLELVKFHIKPQLWETFINSLNFEPAINVEGALYLLLTWIYGRMGEQTHGA